MIKTRGKNMKNHLLGLSDNGNRKREDIMKEEISKEVQDLLENNKKIEICEALHGHTANSDVCSRCGAMVNLNTNRGKDKVLMKSLFYRAVKKMPVTRMIDNIWTYDSKRDYKISTYVEAGKYLIDHVVPKIKNKKIIHDTISAAFVMGYYSKDRYKAMGIEYDPPGEVIDRAVMSRYTVNIMRGVDNFVDRKYDKEQIDELFFFDENIPIKDQFDYVNVILMIAPEYFSRKMTELYEQKKFKKLKIFGNIFITSYVFKDVDSRFTPFIAASEINLLAKDPILSEYKQEIIDSYKYLDLDNGDDEIGKNLILLSNIPQSEKKEHRMISLIDNTYRKSDISEREIKKMPSLRFIPSNK